MDHKFDVNRILSCSVSVLLKTADSLLEPVESLCWAAGGAVRTGGSAPEDIWRNRLTRWGTVLRMPPCRAEPGACGPATEPAWGGSVAKDSPDEGGTGRVTNDVSCGREGWEAERWRTSRLRLPDCRACALLWTSLRWGEGTCGCDGCCWGCWGVGCCCCCCGCGGCCCCCCCCCDDVEGDG